MAVRPIDAARRICELGDWGVSNLKLQKILYMAQMVHLGRTGERLIDAGFQAWDYGPVLPEIYQRAKMFGSDPIVGIFSHAESTEGKEEDAVLVEAAENLMHRSPGELVAETHWSKGAWAKNYRPNVWGIAIPDRDIIDEYERRVGIAGGRG